MIELKCCLFKVTTYQSSGGTQDFFLLLGFIGLKGMIIRPVIGIYIQAHYPVSFGKYLTSSRQRNIKFSLCYDLVCVINCYISSYKVYNIARVLKQQNKCYLHMNVWLGWLKSFIFNWPQRGGIWQLLMLYVLYCLLCCINISYFVYETSALFMHSTTLQIRFVLQQKVIGGGEGFVYSHVFIRNWKRNL